MEATLHLYMWALGATFYFVSANDLARILRNPRCLFPDLVNLAGVDLEEVLVCVRFPTELGQMPHIELQLERQNECEVGSRGCFRCRASGCSNISGWPLCTNLFDNGSFGCLGVHHHANEVPFYILLNASISMPRFVTGRLLVMKNECSHILRFGTHC